MLKIDRSIAIAFFVLGMLILNTLTGFAQSLDVVSNPIKVYLPLIANITNISPAPSVLSQKIAVPAYFDPGDSTWAQLVNGAPTVGPAVINPNNGPSTSRDPGYVTQVNNLKAKNMLALGYIYTSHGQRALNTVKAEIDHYYQWYGVDGIFLDEVYYTDCTRLNYYQALYTYIKGKGGQTKVVLNPGIDFPECLMAVSDIAINFEDTYTHYINWRPTGWEVRYPATRFWQLVHTTPQANLPTAIQLSKQRNAGWLYVTPDKGVNPWDTLPGLTYWNDELNRASH